MPQCTIHRLFRGQTTDHVFTLPTHPTFTGDENHFAKAHHDATMILQGMQAADELVDWSDDNPPRYRLHAITMD